MKKILKFISLFVITIGCLFVFSETALANCDGYENCKVSTDRSSGRILAYMSGSNTYRGSLSSNTATSVASEVENGYKYTDYGIGIYASGTQRPSTSTFGIYKDDYGYMWCLDAGLGQLGTVYAERFLVDSNSGLGIQAQDYALMTIMINASGSSVTDRWAIQSAIRAIVIAFKNDTRSSIESYNNAHYAVYGTVGNWLNSDSSISSAYSALQTALSEQGSTSALRPTSDFTSWYSNGYYYTGNGVDTFKSLFLTGLQAATEFVQNYGTGATVEVQSLNQVPTYFDAEDDGVGSVVSADAYHNIEIGGFTNLGSDDSTASFVISGINFDNGSVPEGLISYYVSSISYDGTEYLTYSSQAEAEAMYGTNLLEALVAAGADLSEAKTMVITVHFEGYESLNDDNDTLHAILNCGDQPMGYELYGTYNTGTENYFGQYYGVVWYAQQTSETQRFISLEDMGTDDSGSEDSDWTSENAVSLIDACDCDDLVEACIDTDDWSSDECQTLVDENCGECDILEAQCGIGDQDACQEYATSCEFECNTTVDNFECCDAEDGYLIIGQEYHEVSINGPSDDDIVACYVTQVDNQFNSSTGYADAEGVVDEEDNSYTTYQNKYCLVSCKEDYDMQMPTAQLVNAGRYFTFSATVEGTKTCYTNSVNIGEYGEEGSFVDDIVEAQLVMIDAYNTYRWWEVLAAAEIEEIEGTYPTNPSCSPSGCSVLTEDATYYPTMEVEGIVDDWFTITDIDEATGVVSVTPGDHYAYDSSEHQEPVGENTYECSGTTSDGDTCGDSDIYYTGWNEVKSVDAYKAELEGKRDEYRGILEDAIANYEAIINEFKACTDDTWSSAITYDAEVYYTYEEDYLADFYNNYGEMEETSKSQTSDSTLWYCVGELGDLEYTVCSGVEYSSLESTKTEKKFTVCTPEDGCYEEDRPDYYDLSDAEYVKKISTVSASYRPATLFYNVYPSGRITSSAVDNSVALDNALPVALSTERGIYKYTVNINNLGEYYDDVGTTGRLVGGASGRDAVINSSSDWSTWVSDDGSIQYMCSYLVNISPTEASSTTWICDMDGECTDGNCFSSCRGPGCDDNTCDGDNCVQDCVGVGCAYDTDAGGAQFSERIVSLANIFPNGTSAYNWTNTKGQTTISMIQDSDKDNADAVFEGTPILSVTISPSTGRAIQSYNESEESNGGYSNDTLSCYAIGSYERIACYSSFIEDLINGVYGDSVVNSDSEVLSVRDEGNNDTDYFTTWTGTISEDLMMGPSWY